MASSRPGTPNGFFEAELKSALDECGFGIAGFEITRSSALDATAEIMLHEGEVIEVMLFSKGYKVHYLVVFGYRQSDSDALPQ